MKKWIATSLLVLCFLAMILPIHATDLQRQNAMLARMFGFQYPLDSAGGYKAGWITRFNESEIEQDFQKIRSNFPQVNMLRIPIGWTDMNQPILITEMEKIIALGKTYSFKFMFVLMDRVSGWWDTGADPRNLLPDKWAYQETRIQPVVEHFRHEDQIYAWALSNELNVFQEVVHEWYAYFVPFVKKIDTDTPVCTSFYSLGLNSSTISAAESLSEIGLDFVEFHYYPTEASDIVSDVDQLTAFVQKPIFLSEFGVNGGLDEYNTDVNKRILNETIQEFQKRPNVLGLAYYRWSDDNDDYSIWNSTSQTPRPESEMLGVSTSFLQRFPYPCLGNLQSSQTTEYGIDDPSFRTVMEWPDETGWVKWNNHTSYELVNATTPTVSVSGQTQVDFSNYEFEDDFIGWNFTGSGNRVIDSSIAHHGKNSLKMWATESNDSQMQYNVSGIQADHAYLLEGWVKVTEANNAGAAFIQLAFRNNSTNWTHWSEAESVDRVTDWVAIHAAAIAPDNVTDLLINCRVNGNGGNITAYFDYLTLWEVPPAAYDGNSYMVAFGEEMDPELNNLQLSQGFEFTNPPDDIKKTWTFSAKLGTALSPEYDTDWKGVFIQLVFTTENTNEWITWFTSEYLSSNHNWTDINVSAIPPSNARALKMIIKVVNAHYGVLFIDDARLTSKPALIPKELSMPLIGGETRSYNVTLLFEGINGTIANGTWILGDSAITDANVTYTEASFGTELNGTSQIISFTFTILTSNIWASIGLALGITGFCMVTVGLLAMMKMLKRKKPERLVLSLICIIIGISLILIWLLTL